jgi:molybdopterin-guanine dinucleotide biosynthesis protein A
LEKNKICALILCGGESSRMGFDKSMLIYHGMPQRDYLHGLASALCSQVLMSCQERQVTSFAQNFSLLVDSAKYSNIGPMAALLTAFSQYPGCDFLLLGCDYPYLNEADIKQLMLSQVDKASVSSFFNPDSGFAEPMLGLYKEGCFKLLLEQYTSGDYSLQRFLTNTGALKLIPSSLQSLRSVDTPEAYEEVLVELKTKRV